MVLITLVVTGVLTGCFFSDGVSVKGKSSNTKEPVISDDSLLTLVQNRTFQYFWEGADPVSGMARERIHMDGIYPENDMNIVTTGGTGFGVMAILTGIERGFISREQGLERIQKITDFLDKADRFHGAWPHWLYGETGRVKPFSPKDDGADIVETAYLMQGLLAARQYFNQPTESEKKLVADINRLWEEIEWDWFTRGGRHVIYWHWSPRYEWEMNFPVEGYNECLILYVLAASSTTHPVEPAAYHDGWARKGKIRGNSRPYGYNLALKHNGAEEYGGPLFWAHYSFLGLDPRHLKDQYADYWEHNVNQTLINRQWCIENPGKYKGYGPDCWGLTAGYSPVGYAAHAPGRKTDLGVISPTAALGSFPYTPQFSMEVLKCFYYRLGDKIWGKYGFYDGFSETANWYPKRYLAIDQGPEVVMMENYRSGLLWKLFMSCPEIQRGLDKLGFEY
ncbi:MAG: glucoamylase family protein [Bacteroidales bacterium]